MEALRHMAVPDRQRRSASPWRSSASRSGRSRRRSTAPGSANCAPPRPSDEVAAAGTRRASRAPVARCRRPSSLRQRPRRAPPSRVTTPWRSSSSSASARGSTSPSNRGATSDQRPCVGVADAPRSRAKRRRLRRGLAESNRLDARRGCQASLVTRPLHTRSQSAGSASPGSTAAASTRSCQKSAPPARACASRTCASRSSISSEPGGPIAGASSR